MAIYFPSCKPFKKDKQNMLGTARELRINYRLLHVDKAVLADQQKLTFFSYLRMLGTVLRTYQVWWPIRMDGERKPKEFVMLADPNDDEECSHFLNQQNIHGHFVRGLMVNLTIIMELGVQSALEASFL